MTTILFWLYIAIQIVEIFLFVSIIASFVKILTWNFRIPFVDDIMQPIYRSVKVFFPTQIGFFDISPIIIIILISILKNLILKLDPKVWILVSNLL